MRELIGHVDVDSGQVLIVDPCYLEDFDNETEYMGDDTDIAGAFGYSGVSSLTVKHSYGQVEHGAVASSTAYGDGSYPVYAEVERGVVKRLVVDFMQEEEGQ